MPRAAVLSRRAILPDTAVFRKRLRRSQVRPFFAAQPPFTVAMEACGSAHYWAREIGMLGHAVWAGPGRSTR
jgi:transposase